MLSIAIVEFYQESPFVNVFNSTETPLFFLLLLGALVTLALYFLISFILPSVTLIVRIKRAVRQLRSIKRNDVSEGIMDDIFARDRYLARSWHTYKRSLVTGAGGAVNKRATMPAAMCFDKQENIEVPLKLEFFRHCPGLMTGIGIFGTFSGLLLGLHQFADAMVAKAPSSVAEGTKTTAATGGSGAEGAFVSFGHGASALAAIAPTQRLKVLDHVSEIASGAHVVAVPGLTQAATGLKAIVDVDAMAAALGHLLHSVSEAFVVSAIAVLSALCTTFIEKLVVAYCFHYLQELSSTIDGYYAFNPAEDYMIRLTRATEATETQARRIAAALDGMSIVSDRA
jgi:hypothetical protein